MKLAENFVEVCLNYQSTFDMKKKEFMEQEGEDSHYWIDEKVVDTIISDLFQIEEKDFHRAIALCKVFKRSIQKKAYEHKLQLFQETGEYPNSVSPDCFISDLKNQLCGNRRCNYDKIMLVNASLKEYFPELDQVNAAVELLQFCKVLPVIERNFTRAKERLEKYQEKFSMIQLWETAGKSVQEIWTGLQENDQN